MTPGIQRLARRCHLQRISAVSFVDSDFADAQQQAVRDDLGVGRDFQVDGAAADEIDRRAVEGWCVGDPRMIGLAPFGFDEPRCAVRGRGCPDRGNQRIQVFKPDGTFVKEVRRRPS